jgi:pyruvate/2-oxoglutarate dehydrogenase complex dihydrolipoamide acyltransferase (E2) component
MGRIKMKKLTRVPVFRKIAMGTWNTVGDPSVYASLEIEMTAANRFMAELSEASGIKITPSHLVGKVVAQVLEARPEINGMIRFSRIYLREQVDIFYQVNVPGGGDHVSQADLSGTVVRRAEKLSVVEIAQALRAKVEEIRQGRDREITAAKNMMRLVPWWLIKTVLNLTSFLTYTLNLNLGWAGIPKDPFGSVMITNVGSLGGNMEAWAPLVPYSRVPLLLTVGPVLDRPWVVDGRVEVRPVMKIGVTFDHRFMDGVHGAAMARHFLACFNDPWKHLQG